MHEMIAVNVTGGTGAGSKRPLKERRWTHQCWPTATAFRALTTYSCPDCGARRHHALAREQRQDEFRRGLAWANGVLGDPGAVAVAASGMSEDDIAEIDAALNGRPT